MGKHFGMIISRSPYFRIEDVSKIKLWRRSKKNTAVRLGKEDTFNTKNMYSHNLRIGWWKNIFRVEFKGSGTLELEGVWSDKGRRWRINWKKLEYNWEKKMEIIEIKKE